jgi:2-alkenal reductase
MMRISRAAFTVILTAAVMIGAALGSAASLSTLRVSGQEFVDDQSTLLERLYQDVNPSVVALDVRVPADSASLELLPTDPNDEGQPNVRASGSGFVYDTQGHIVTNAHVVEDAKSISVLFSDGTVIPAERVGFDSDSDLAVIKVDASKLTLPRPLTLADSEQVVVGQRAVAFGNPFDLPGTMTEGIVSATDRSLLGRLVGESSYRIPQVIQTDAAINPGNSGGPLVNFKGEVIGVNTAIWSRVRQSSGVGFAVPSNLIRIVADQIIASGKAVHSYLGITGRSLTVLINEALGLDPQFKGVLVQGVVDGGPADKAGLKAGSREATIDEIPVVLGGDIILAVDDVQVRYFDDLLAYLFTKTRPQQEVALKIYRGGDTITVKVTLGTRPTD